MKINRFGAFTFGVLITAVSVGAVTYANAAGDATIKACANKTTGAMRYISKGSCKKTEKILTWNQMGLEGALGAKGDTGATGSAGPSGQNLHAVDATGKDLGIITEGNSTNVTIFSDGGLWSWYSNMFRGGNVINGFTDSTCTVPIAWDFSYVPSASYTFPPTTRWLLAKSQDELPTAAYKATGQPFDIETLSTIYVWRSSNQTCTARTTSTYFSENTDGFTIATNLTAVSLPTYTAPLTIVAK
jgi:hypothetical protein